MFLETLLAWFSDAATWSGTGGIPNRTLQHLWYSAASVGIAAAIGLPLGVVIGHTNRASLLAINATNAGRALPSFGIVILVFTLAGFGFLPALVALVALAVPPIVTNAHAGIRSVDPAVRDAATGMGMTGWQLLWRVELPLAVPLVMAGVRTSVVQVIATATLAAYVGLGGLGRYLIDGLARRDLAQVLGGAILVGLLAILAEVALGRLQALVTRGARLEPDAEARIIASGKTA